MKSVCLLEEIQHQLHSSRDYKEVLEIVLKNHPPLKHYLEVNALPLLGDWPTFFSFKKLIAKVEHIIKIYL